MRRINRRLRKFTANVLDLPQDVIFDLPRVTLIGNMQLYIENHRGVSEFTSEMLRLSLSKGAMEIYGKNLVIRAILTEEIFIEGEVSGVKYLP
ncbi:sporulation protein YqfC [Paenibacillus gansuensis]|uniref:Sporulation protein YqfC n=1 Tax=Paenibacillus gansuensis TaxID=306542 RepID=A0ABW5PBN1_9BACL